MGIMDFIWNKKFEKKMERSHKESELRDAVFKSEHIAEANKVHERVREMGIDMIPDQELILAADGFFDAGACFKAVVYYDELLKRNYIDNGGFGARKAAHMYYFGYDGVEKDKVKAGEMMMHYWEQYEDTRIAPTDIIGVLYDSYRKTKNAEDHKTLAVFDEDRMDRIMEKSMLTIKARVENPRSTSWSYMDDIEKDSGKWSFEPDLMAAEQYDAYMDLERLGYWQTPRTSQAVVELFRCQAEKGDAAAMYWLAVCHFTRIAGGNAEEAEKLLREAHQKGYAAATSEYYRSFRQNLSGSEYDALEADMEKLQKQSREFILNFKPTPKDKAAARKEKQERELRDLNLSTILEGHNIADYTQEDAKRHKEIKRANKELVRAAIKNDRLLKPEHIKVMQPDSLQLMAMGLITNGDDQKATRYLDELMNRGYRDDTSWCYLLIINCFKVSAVPDLEKVVRIKIFEIENKKETVIGSDEILGSVHRDYFASKVKPQYLYNIGRDKLEELFRLEFAKAKAEMPEYDKKNERYVYKADTVLLYEAFRDLDALGYWRLEHTPDAVVKHLRTLARQGNMAAMYWLCMCYHGLVGDVTYAEYGEYVYKMLMADYPPALMYYGMNKMNSNKAVFEKARLINELARDYLNAYNGGRPERFSEIYPDWKSQLDLLEMEDDEVPDYTDDDSIKDGAQLQNTEDELYADQTEDEYDDEYEDECDDDADDEDDADYSSAIEDADCAQLLTEVAETMLRHYKPDDEAGYGGATVRKWLERLYTDDSFNLADSIKTNYNNWAGRLPDKDSLIEKLCTAGLHISYRKAMNGDIFAVVDLFSAGYVLDDMAFTAEFAAEIARAGNTYVLEEMANMYDSGHKVFAQTIAALHAEGVPGAAQAVKYISTSNEAVKKQLLKEIKELSRKDDMHFEYDKGEEGRYAAAVAAMLEAADKAKDEDPVEKLRNRTKANKSQSETSDQSDFDYVKSALRAAEQLAEHLPADWEIPSEEETFTVKEFAEDIFSYQKILDFVKAVRENEDGIADKLPDSEEIIGQITRAYLGGKAKLASGRDRAAAADMFRLCIECTDMGEITLRYVEMVAESGINYIIYGLLMFHKEDCFEEYQIEDMLERLVAKGVSGAEAAQEYLSSADSDRKKEIKEQLRMADSFDKDKQVAGSVGKDKERYLDGIKAFWS